MSLIIEINNKKYMNTKIAANCWSLTSKTIAEYCRENRIQDKIKIKNKWYIWINETKPLSKSDIHNLLILTLKLKNRPQQESDFSNFNFDCNTIEVVYKQLAFQKYIEDFTIANKKRIPYEVILTDKGFQEAITNNNTLNFNETINITSKILSIILNVTQILSTIKNFSG